MQITMSLYSSSFSLTFSLSLSSVMNLDETPVYKREYGVHRY